MYLIFFHFVAGDKNYDDKYDYYLDIVDCYMVDLQDCCLILWWIWILWWIYRIVIWILLIVIWLIYRIVIIIKILFVLIYCRNFKNSFIICSTFFISIFILLSKTSILTFSSADNIFLSITLILVIKLFNNLSLLSSSSFF
ncbi:MAG: hypothetical protein AB2N28_6010 [Candidatus Phytoplasma solani]